MTRRVSLIALVALVVLLGGWYVAAWSPEKSHINALNAQQVQAQSQIQSLHMQLDSLEVQKGHLKAYRADMVALQHALPEGPSLDQVIRTLVRAAAGAKVGLTGVSAPQPAGWGAPGAAAAVATAGPESLALSVAFQGSDAGALAFVDTLETQPRLYVVNSLQLSSAPKAAAKSAAAATGISSYSLSVTAFYVSAASNSPVYPG